VTIAGGGSLQLFGTGGITPNSIPTSYLTVGDTGTSNAFLLVDGASSLSGNIVVNPNGQIVVGSSGGLTFNALTSITEGATGPGLLSIQGTVTVNAQTSIDIGTQVDGSLTVNGGVTLTLGQLTVDDGATVNLNAEPSGFTVVMAGACSFAGNINLQLGGTDTYSPTDSVPVLQCTSLTGQFTGWRVDKGAQKKAGSIDQICNTLYFNPNGQLNNPTIQPCSACGLMASSLLLAVLALFATLLQ